MKTLLLVESNTTGTGREFARQARDLGLRPVLITSDPGRYPYVQQDRLPFMIADTGDHTAVLNAARRIADDGRIAGVTSSSEYFIATAAVLARTLGLPGPSSEAVNACRHKRRQRCLLKDAGVPVPRFASVSQADAAVEAARELGLPVVVKPVHGSGSVGVRLCTDASEVAAHAAALLGSPVNERDTTPAQEILVEEYLRGDEFSVETFGPAVVTTVRKQLSLPPHFVETGHDVPSGLSLSLAGELKDCAARAVNALGLRWGASHVEIRMADSGPSVIEVNPRLAGGLIPKLVELATGIDMIRAQVAAAVGMAVELVERSRSGASIRFLTADRAGSVGGRASAIEAALNVERVLLADIYRAEGDLVAPAADFRGRVGHVIAWSENEHDAADAAEAGLRKLREAVSEQPATVSGTKETE